jgi:hypothetical protein
MPSLDQIFPYVQGFGQRATDSGACAASSIILLVRLAARISSRSLTLPLSRVEHFFMDCGASATHGILVANSLFVLGLLWLYARCKRHI